MKEESFESLRQVNWKIPSPYGLERTDFTFVAPERAEDERREVETDREVEILELTPGRSTFDMAEFQIIKVLRGTIVLLADMEDDESPLEKLLQGQWLEFDKILGMEEGDSCDMIIGTKDYCVIELSKKDVA